MFIATITRAQLIEAVEAALSARSARLPDHVVAKLRAVAATTNAVAVGLFTTDEGVGCPLTQACDGDVDCATGYPSGFPFAFDDAVSDRVPDALGQIGVVEVVA